MTKDDLSDFMPVSQKQVGRRSVRQWFVIHAIAWGLLLALLFVGARKFEGLFRDFGVDLPAVSVLILKLSHLGPALGLLTLGILGIDWFVLVAMSRMKEPVGYRRWCRLMLAIPVGLVLVTVVGLMMPLTNVLARLQR